MKKSGEEECSVQGFNLNKIFVNHPRMKIETERK